MSALMREFRRVVGVEVGLPSYKSVFDGTGVVRSTPPPTDKIGVFDVYGPERFADGWYALWGEGADRKVTGPHRQPSHALTEARYYAACAHQDRTRRSP